MELLALVTTTEKVEIAGKTYRRLDQASSSSLNGLVGTHIIEEALYRDAGIRNGPTIKPIELRVGAVTRTMLPDLACIAGLLHGYISNREVKRVLVEMDLLRPVEPFSMAICAT